MAKKWIQIGAIVIIVVVTAGIFLVKTTLSEDGVANVEHTTYKVQSALSSHDSVSNATETPLKITKVDLKKIKEYGKPTVIDFGSGSCIPCKKMAPVLETLNAEWQGCCSVYGCLEIFGWCQRFPCISDSYAGVF